MSNTNIAAVTAFTEGRITRPMLDWLLGSDAGISSRVIWRVMTGVGLADFKWWEVSPPLDPDDFGRCYRLLARFPEWKTRMREVAERFPEWASLVRRWDILTRLYEVEIQRADRRAPRLYAAMLRSSGQSRAALLYERGGSR